MNFEDSVIDSNTSYAELQKVQSFPPKRQKALRGFKNNARPNGCWPALPDLQCERGSPLSDLAPKLLIIFFVL